MFEINLRNMEHMELTYPLWIMDYHLLQPFPNEESRLTNIVKPFTTMVINRQDFFKERNQYK